MITPYWSKVHALLGKVLGIPIPLHPLYLLLGLPLPKTPKPLRKLMAFILLAAKRAIPECWLSNVPPSFTQFLTATIDIRRMERLTAVIEDSLTSFDAIWEKWDSSEYNSEIAQVTLNS